MNYKGQVKSERQVREDKMSASGENQEHGKGSKSEGLMEEVKFEKEIWFERIQ